MVGGVRRDPVDVDRSSRRSVVGRTRRRGTHSLDQSALRHQLGWLILTIEVAMKPEEKSEKAKKSMVQIPLVGGTIPQQKKLHSTIR